MSVQELKERYVYAVSRLLPHKMREDISAELDTLIEDMLEERCQDRPAEEKDLRVVLAELGSPSEMANHYSPDKDKCLIGPPLFQRLQVCAADSFPCGDRRNAAGRRNYHGYG